MKKNSTKNPAREKINTFKQEIPQKLANLYERFCKLNFKDREEIVVILSKRLIALRNSKKADSEGVKFCAEIHELFIEKHCELTRQTRILDLSGHPENLNILAEQITQSLKNPLTPGKVRDCLESELAEIRGAQDA